LCLDALARQNYAPDRVEVIVADNGSPAGEAAVREAIAGRARLVLAPEKGAGPARNAGAAAAEGEVLAFTDADCVPEPGWLAAGVAALAGADLVGGRVTVFTQDPDRLSPAEAFECAFAFDNARYVQRLGFTVTANLFCWSSVFADVGGFDNGVSEDLEWSHRARAKGYRLAYSPEAVVAHPARRTWPELVAKWRRLNAESFALMQRRPAGALTWLLRTLLLPPSAVAHTPKVLASRNLSSWRDRLAAVNVLFRLRLWRSWDALRLLAGARR
jgi:GT2 family glycosyltransferase